MTTLTIMTVRELIHLAFGDKNTNNVNFKHIETVLYLLARQLSILKRQVEVKIDPELIASLIKTPSNLSVTEVKIHATVPEELERDLYNDALQPSAVEEIHHIDNVRKSKSFTLPSEKSETSFASGESDKFKKYPRNVSYGGVKSKFIDSQSSNSLEKEPWAPIKKPKQKVKQEKYFVDEPLSVPSHLSEAPVDRRKSEEAEPTAKDKKMRESGTGSPPDKYKLITVVTKEQYNELLSEIQALKRASTDESNRIPETKAFLNKLHKIDSVTHPMSAMLLSDRLEQSEKKLQQMVSALQKLMPKDTHKIEHLDDDMTIINTSASNIKTSRDTNLTLSRASEIKRAPKRASSTKQRSSSWKQNYYSGMEFWSNTFRTDDQSIPEVLLIKTDTEYVDKNQHDGENQSSTPTSHTTSSLEEKKTSDYIKKQAKNLTIETEPLDGDNVRDPEHHCASHFQELAKSNTGFSKTGVACGDIIMLNVSNQSNILRPENKEDITPIQQNKTLGTQNRCQSQNGSILGYHDKANTVNKYCEVKRESTEKSINLTNIGNDVNNKNDDSQSVSQIYKEGSNLLLCDYDKETETFPPYTRSIYDNGDLRDKHRIFIPHLSDEDGSPIPWSKIDNLNCEDFYDSYNNDGKLASLECTSTSALSQKVSSLISFFDIKGKLMEFSNLSQRHDTDRSEDSAHSVKYTYEEVYNETISVQSNSNEEVSVKYKEIEENNIKQRLLIKNEYISAHFPDIILPDTSPLDTGDKTRRTTTTTMFTPEVYQSNENEKDNFFVVYDTPATEGIHLLSSKSKDLKSSEPYKNISHTVIVKSPKPKKNKKKSDDSQDNLMPLELDESVLPDFTDFVMKEIKEENAILHDDKDKSTISEMEKNNLNSNPKLYITQNKHETDEHVSKTEDNKGKVKPSSLNFFDKDGNPISRARLDNYDEVYDLDGNFIPQYKDKYGKIIPWAEMENYNDLYDEYGDIAARRVTHKKMSKNALSKVHDNDGKWKVRAYDNVGKLIPSSIIDATDPIYDKKGNIIQRVYDEDGKPIAWSKMSFVDKAYDKNGKLVSPFVDIIDDMDKNKYSITRSLRSEFDNDDDKSDKQIQRKSSNVNLSDQQGKPIIQSQINMNENNDKFDNSMPLIGADKVYDKNKNLSLPVYDKDKNSLLDSNINDADKISDKSENLIPLYDKYGNRVSFLRKTLTGDKMYLDKMKVLDGTFDIKQSRHLNSSLFSNISRSFSRPKRTSSEPENLKALDWVVRRELELGMLTLQEDIERHVNVFFGRTNETAQQSIHDLTKISDQLNATLTIECIIPDIDKQIMEFTQRITTVELFLVKKMTQYQDEITQQQIQLETTIEAMVEAIANVAGDPQAIDDLNSDLMISKNDLDMLSLSQRDLQDMTNNLKLDLRELRKQQKILGSVKADHAEISEALKGKASIADLNQVVSLEEFTGVLGEMALKITKAFDKFNNQEYSWQTLIEELAKCLSKKGNVISLMALSKDITTNANKLREKKEYLSSIIGELERKYNRRQIDRADTCLCCNTAVIVLETQEPNAAGVKTHKNKTTAETDKKKRKGNVSGELVLCYPGLPPNNGLDSRSAFCDRYCGRAQNTAKSTKNTAPLCIPKEIKTKSLVISETKIKSVASRSETLPTMQSNLYQL